MMNKKGTILLSVVSICVLLVGCNSDGKETVVSENTVSVAEEIAGGVSENVIPQEALTYNGISFPIPEEFVEWEENTDTSRLYVSNVYEDYSFIYYERSVRRETDCLPTEEEMRAEAEETFAGGVLKSYEVTEQEGYEKSVSEITFTNEDGIAYTMWSYTYLTEEYWFMVQFVEGGIGDWETTFSQCGNEIVLTNVLGDELQ